MMIEFKECSMVSRNVRGFASRKSQELILKYHPDVIFLYETHTMIARY